MSSEVQLFNNPEFGEIRIVDVDSEPYFVGKDVASILGYTNPQKALRDHLWRKKICAEILSPQVGTICAEKISRVVRAGSYDKKILKKSYLKSHPAYHRIQIRHPPFAGRLPLCSTAK